MEMTMKIIFFAAALLHVTSGATVRILDSNGIVRTAPFVLTMNKPDGQVPLQLSGFTAPSFVSCQLTQSEAGFSKANFSVISASVNTSRVDVPYRLLSAGRTNAILCYQSYSNGTAQPGSLNSTASSELSFTVKPGAYLSFCSNAIPIANDGSNSGTFSLQFSDVTSSLVTVSCSVNRTGASQQIGLFIDSRVAAAGSQTIQMLYNITNKQYGGVYVTCRAQSASGSFQYINTTSQTTPPAFFILDRAVVSILPEAVYTHTASFTVLLSLDSAIAAQSTKQVKFSCAVSSIAAGDGRKPVASGVTCAAPSFSSGSTIPTTASATTVTAAATFSNTSTSSVWQLSEPIVIFDGVNYRANHSFEVTRLSEVTSPTVELVAVSCCAQSQDNSDPRYAGLAAAMTAVADLLPEPGLNASGATDAVNMTVETILKNPAYVDMAPCPCDLTGNACDVECCCDQDCTKADAGAFSSCLAGYYGGRASTTPSYMCNLTLLGARDPDWSPFLCVERENNAYLGMFFETRQTVRSNVDFAAAISSDSSTSYRRTDSAATAAGSASLTSASGGSTATVGYAYGMPVEMTGPVTVLALPQLTLDGRCLPTAPVRYLKDFETVCPYSVTKTLCAAADSPLSAGSYVSRSSVPPTLQCPDQPPPYLVKRPGNGTASAAAASVAGTAPVSVKYRCAAASSSYVGKSIAATASAAAAAAADQQDASYLASPSISSRQTGSSSTIAASSAAACPWDDGYSAPPAPSYEGGVCRNAVAEVLYNITWQGVDVISMDVTLVFVDVSVQQSNPLKLSAKYAAAFTPYGATPTHVSGNPGYDFGSPLIAGKMNTTTVDGLDGPLNHSSISVASSPHLVSADATTLCQNAYSVPMSFRVDSISQCTVAVTASNMHDCDSLRSQMLVKLEAWANQEYLSIGGIAYPNDTTQWIKIVREPFKMTNSSNGSLNISAQSTTTADPAFVDQQFGDYTLPDATVIQLTGECVNVPSSAHLTIMYAEVGKSLNVPIYQIVGARMRYGGATWRILCSSSNCLGNAAHKFLVTTTVNFIQVPAQREPYSSSYDVRTALNCTACIRSWTDLLYPIGLDAPGDLRAYNLANFLWLVLFVVGLFVLSGPWWSCW